MKVTIDNLINFMREKENIIITDEQVEEIKKYFYKDVKDLVYWSYSESNSYFNIKLEGIITKEFYERVPIDANKVFFFGEVVDNMGDVEFKIEDLEFDGDPETIITYENTEIFYDYMYLCHK